MTSIGWEFWGIKFSYFLIAMVSVAMFLYTWVISHKDTRVLHVDGMAGDEGDD